MSLIVSDFGIVTLFFLIGAYFVAAKSFTLGAMSLPAMLVMTSFIYFYVMPALAFPDGRATFLGLHIYSLEWQHLAVGIYALAGTVVCYLRRQILVIDPAAPQPSDRPLDMRMFIALVIITVLAVFALAALGRLNLYGEESVELSAEAENLRFVNLFLTMLLPLTIVYLVRSNFSSISLGLLVPAIFVMLVSGFRYRLIFMAFAITAAFLMVRRIKVFTSFVLVATFVGLLGTNFMVNTRNRGSGLDLSLIEGMSWVDILKSFGGEVGPLFSFSNVTDHPIRELYYFEPWYVGLARLVPSYFWRDKPTPDYLYIPLEGFPANAKAAGVAIPQHVEILLQFGWIGLPILAFLYFYFATSLLARLSRLGREVRVTAFAFVPIFFGFYMQTRGYFFQLLSDGLFMFGPLYLLHAFNRGPRSQQARPFSSRLSFDPRPSRQQAQP